MSREAVKRSGEPRGVRGDSSRTWRFQMAGQKKGSPRVRGFPSAPPVKDCVASSARAFCA